MKKKMLPFLDSEVTVTSYDQPTYLIKNKKPITDNYSIYKFKCLLIQYPSETSSLEYIKTTNITVSFFIQLTVVSVC